MIIQVPAVALAKCRGLVQEFKKSKSGFKEMGGYLIGSYDGDFKITQFILDQKAESTGTRIKLSAECYHEVEQQLADHPLLNYIGSWHVHPGKMKPTYSHTDEATLFLEKLVIKTDNPKEFRCPRIHLIFNEDLTQISAYTLRVRLDYDMLDLWKAEKTIQDSDLAQIDEILNRLQHIKKEFLQFKKNQKLEQIENCFYELGEARREIDELIDKTEEISDFQEKIQLITKAKKKIEDQIKDKTKKGEQIGILLREDNDKITISDYRPNIITQSQEDDNLIGFWKHYSLENPPSDFQDIFLTNFFIKTGEDDVSTFIYVISTPNNLIFFVLRVSEFSGIYFEDVEIVLEETE